MFEKLLEILEFNETAIMALERPIYDVLIMNPPFKSFDAFVEKAKRISNKVYCIGKMNFFGSHGRNINKLWEHLEWVLPFDRMIAFDRPETEDGKVKLFCTKSAK